MNERIAVRRTGGFLGRPAEGGVDVREAPAEVVELVDRILAAPAPRGGLPEPDHYVYAFDLRGTELVVPEQHLTEDLRELADRLLR